MKSKERKDKIGKKMKYCKVAWRRNRTQKVNQRGGV